MACSSSSSIPDYCVIPITSGTLMPRAESTYHPDECMAEQHPSVTIKSSKTVLTEYMQRLLTPSETACQHATSTPRVSTHEDREDIASRGSTEGQEGLNTAVRVKRKRVSEIVDVETMVADGFECCKTLRCVETFTSGGSDLSALRAEQAVMARLSGDDRATFVGARVPLVRPDSGRIGGSMHAGQRRVCTRFFRKAFNVSNNMIQSVKNNPRSPAVLP